MVDIPTYLTAPVILNCEMTTPVQYHGEICGRKNKRLIPDLQFRRAVVGVGTFLIVLSSVLVGAVMWFSYQYTDKEIERNFWKLYNITQKRKKDI